MGRRIRAKAKDPQVAAAEKRARDFQSVGLSADSASLRTSADLTVEPAQRGEAGKRGHEDRARRVDAFEALKDGLQRLGVYAIARKYEVDVVTAAGEHDRGRSLNRVDGDRPGGREDDMIDASKRVKFVRGQIGAFNANLLDELISPSALTRLCGPTWRDTVSLIAHETNEHAQAAVVRLACLSLAAAYRAWDAAQIKTTRACVAA